MIGQSYIVNKFKTSNKGVLVTIKHQNEGIGLD